MFLVSVGEEDGDDVGDAVGDTVGSLVGAIVGGAKQRFASALKEVPSLQSQ